MQLTAEILTKPRTSAQTTGRAEQDMQEVVARFGQTPTENRQSEGRSARSIEHLLNSGAPVSNYNTNTYGRVTFHRLNEQPRNEHPQMEKLVTDVDLQSRLEALCESLRSQY